MIRVHVPIYQKTRIGAVRNGLTLIMRIEMHNVSTGERYYEERWAEPSNARPLARPTNGHGRYFEEWAEVTARSRGGVPSQSRSEEK